MSETMYDKYENCYYLCRNCRSSEEKRTVERETDSHWEDGRLMHFVTYRCIDCYEYITIDSNDDYYEMDDCIPLGY